MSSDSSLSSTPPIVRPLDLYLRDEDKGQKRMVGIPSYQAAEYCSPPAYPPQGRNKHKAESSPESPSPLSLGPGIVDGSELHAESPTKAGEQTAPKQTSAERETESPSQDVGAFDSDKPRWNPLWTNISEPSEEGPSYDDLMKKMNRSRLAHSRASG